MQPTLEVFNRLSLLLSQDAGSLAPSSNPPKLHLSKTPFTPNQDRIPADFTEADFGGYAAVGAITGNQNVGIDPLTAERFVEMKVPAGGWRFVCTALTNTPQQVYGAYFMNDAGTIVYGCALFPQPFTINTVAQVIDVDSIIFRFLFAGVY